MTKKIEKIYGIHSAMEILKTSPDRILNIWLQDSAKSKPIILIHDAARPNFSMKLMTEKFFISSIFIKKLYNEFYIF